MKIPIFLAALVILSACNPSDTRPGVWLSGQTANETPSDWSFTDAYKEVALEVVTPYFIPHSVTIWCAQMDGVLYVGAGAPEEKNWPGWVDDDPTVRLLIGETIFSGTLADVTDAKEIERLRGAYEKKYDLESMVQGVRYWRVAAPQSDA